MTIERGPRQADRRTDRNATNLSSYLASNFPNIYGVNAASHNLTGKTNAQVAAFYQQLYSESGPKLDAETMALALAAYVTNSGLAGNVATSYGFAVSANGLATATFSVGANGAAFGVNNKVVLTVMEQSLPTNIIVATFILASIGVATFLLTFPNP